MLSRTRHDTPGLNDPAADDDHPFRISASRTQYSKPTLNAQEPLHPDESRPCFQILWRWRHQAPPEHSPWTNAQAEAVAVSTLTACAAKLRQHATEHVLVVALQQVCRLLQGQIPTGTLPAATDHVGFLLFFDGGSRGNPGPGGAGAVVVRVDTTGSAPELIWSAAMSLADPSTTNNYAEYVGLHTGLVAAETHHWTPLTVIGDSQLILRQVSQYRPPRSERLRRLYSQIRHLADRHQIREWRHHLREFNKMADHAANVAMDSKRSLQTFHPSARPEWRGLPPLLHGDILQWRATTLDLAQAP